MLISAFAASLTGLGLDPGFARALTSCSVLTQCYPCRLVSLRLSTRHEFRGPASLFTGKEKAFNKSGLFSTNE